MRKISRFIFGAADLFSRQRLILGAADLFSRQRLIPAKPLILAALAATYHLFFNFLTEWKKILRYMLRGTGYGGLRYCS